MCDMQTTRGTSLSDSTNPEREAGETTGSPRPRRVGVLVAVAVAALAADIVSKIIVVSALQDREPVRLLGGLLTLRETRNSGAAFSIGTGYTIVFTVIACGVVVAILRTARNLRSAPWAVCLGLLLGGAIGNLLDRLLRAPAPLKGHVVDWIQLPHWPVFNLADSAIVCGGVLAVLLAARGLQVDGTRLTGGDGAREEPGTPEAAPRPEPEPEPEPAEAESAEANGEAKGEAEVRAPEEKS
jgi:lipoprotein signal peptidase